VEVAQVVADQQAGRGTRAVNFHAVHEHPQQPAAAVVQTDVSLAHRGPSERAQEEEGETESQKKKFRAQPEGTPGEPRCFSHRAQPRNFDRAEAGSRSRSRKVRKSIVLNSRSSAGGPQIFAPTERYARRSFGTFGACSARWASEHS